MIRYDQMETKASGKVNFAGMWCGTMIVVAAKQYKL